MPSTWKRISMATTAALNEFRRVYTNPQAAAGMDADGERRAAYPLLWSYYQNNAFEEIGRWAAYRSRHRLYRNTRAIYNPARRLVDFYSGIVYQGGWTADPRRMTEAGTAIPFEEGSDPRLLAAIGQVWQWSNWQAQRAIMVRYGAALGDCMIVVVDDLERAKIYFDVVWPGQVAELDLDARGNVTRYVLEYDTTEEGGRQYTYRREVGQRAIHEFADGRQTSEAANPYTFVPAVWIQHTPAAGAHGEPALRNLSKIDELNALAASAHDQAHRVLNAPLLVAGSNIDLTPGRPPSARRTPQQANQAAAEAAQTINIITGGDGARIEAVRLEPGEAISLIEHLITEIEHDHPEITMYQQLRRMSQVTGPAAARMFGDVATLVDAARAQYDRATIALCQMAVAIGGWRLASGAWPNPTRQQQAFGGFDLGSYAAGALDMAIRSRPLIPLTEQEQIEIDRQRLALKADQAYGAGSVAGNAQGAPAGVVARLQSAQAEGRRLE